MSANVSEVKPLPSMQKGPIERYHLVEWCAAENDYYILHYDERFARRMEFEAPLIQGTYKLGLSGAYIAQVFGKDTRIRSISMRYLRPDIEGSLLKLSAELLAQERLDDGYLYRVVIRVCGTNGEVSAEATAEVSTETAIA